MTSIAAQQRIADRPRPERMDPIEQLVVSGGKAALAGLTAGGLTLAGGLVAGLAMGALVKSPFGGRDFVTPLVAGGIAGLITGVVSGAGVGVALAENRPKADAPGLGAIGGGIGGALGGAVAFAGTGGRGLLLGLLGGAALGAGAGFVGGLVARG